MGKLIQAFSDPRQFLGRQPPCSRSEAFRTITPEVCHQTDCQPRGLFEKGMFCSSWNKKDRSGCDRMKFLSDSLSSPAAQVNEKLSVGMAVWTLFVEWLKVPIEPKFVHRPITAAQVKALQEDRAERRIAPRSQGFFSCWHLEIKLGRRIKSLLC